MIKGVKEGLVFLLDDKCEFAVLLDELQYKLEKTHQQLLTGPLVHVGQGSLARMIRNGSNRSFARRAI
jgi:septum formation inhibitor MinC